MTSAVRPALKWLASNSARWLSIDSHRVVQRDLYTEASRTGPSYTPSATLGLVAIYNVYNTTVYTLLAVPDTLRFRDALI